MGSYQGLSKLDILWCKAHGHKVQFQIGHFVFNDNIRSQDILFWKKQMYQRDICYSLQMAMHMYVCVFVNTLLDYHYLIWISHIMSFSDLLLNNMNNCVLTLWWHLMILVYLYLIFYLMLAGKGYWKQKALQPTVKWYSTYCTIKKCILHSASYVLVYVFLLHTCYFRININNNHSTTFQTIVYQLLLLMVSSTSCLLPNCARLMKKQMFF